MLNQFILIASGLHASVYGLGEKMCGDVGRPVSCAIGATTASGEPFDPARVTAAVAAPANVRVVPRVVGMRLVGAETCHPVRVNDKMNPRWIGERGFDLTPAAWRLVTGGATKQGLERIETCDLPAFMIKKKPTGGGTPAQLR